MTTIATTADPPYWAVIFTSLRSDVDDGYDQAAARMVELASQQPGFLGIESVRDGLGITVSYWSDETAMREWKKNVKHREVQRLGREEWYSSFRTRIARVEREYGMPG